MVTQHYKIAILIKASLQIVGIDSKIFLKIFIGKLREKPIIENPVKWWLTFW